MMQLQRRIDRYMKMVPDPSEHVDIAAVGDILPTVEADMENPSWSPEMRRFMAHLDDAD